MRLVTDQNGTKWTVSIYGPKFSLAAGEPLSERISFMTLLFESNIGETRDRRTGKCPLEAISDGELLELLNKDDEDIKAYK
ncbi:MAG: hypothetical protein MUO26_01730 [Methanotrichaceae archaeon]|nr:hypothetical protein [Methanotrichaceae archaeon]